MAPSGPDPVSSQYNHEGLQTGQGHGALLGMFQSMQALPEEVTHGRIVNARALNAKQRCVACVDDCLVLDGPLLKAAKHLENHLIYDLRVHRQRNLLRFDIDDGRQGVAQCTLYRGAHVLRHAVLLQCLEELNGGIKIVLHLVRAHVLQAPNEVGRGFVWCPKESSQGNDSVRFPGQAVPQLRQRRGSRVLCPTDGGHCPLLEAFCERTDVLWTAQNPQNVRELVDD
mmetsp:Transcript_12407/g.32837  ORF Transcript_12407/g.32837 Transcript_12407/m.32837 type:complete len:227 (-) Transcript_12407:534-1214(-)